MDPKPGAKPSLPDQYSPEVAKHVAGAHRLLKDLRAKLHRLEQHPELDEAIREVESALNILTIKTAGLL